MELPFYCGSNYQANQNILRFFEVLVVVNGKEGLAILDQIKTIDKSRLIKKLGKLTKEEMAMIREKIDLVFD